MQKYTPCICSAFTQATCRRQLERVVLVVDTRIVCTILGSWLAARARTVVKCCFPRVRCNTVVIRPARITALRGAAVRFGQCLERVNASPTTRAVALEQRVVIRRNAQRPVPRWKVHCINYSVLVVRPDIWTVADP